MSAITIVQPAPENTVFAAGSFDSEIGKVIPLNLNGVDAGPVRVVSAIVAGNGRSVEFTLEQVDA